MKLKKIFILSAAVMLFVLLSGCSASAMRSNSWSGLSADAEKAYLAKGTFVYAISLSNGSMAWRYPAEKADSKEAYFANPVLSEDGQLIIASAGSNHSLSSLNPATGNLNWTFSDAEGVWIASPLVLGDTLYAPNTDGKLYALDLNGSFLWAKHIGGALWAQPVSDGDFLYITSLDHHVYAFDLQKKEVTWNVDLGGAIPGALALDAEGKLYLGSFASAIVSIDSQSQNLAWETPTKGWIWDAPVLDADTLYVGDLDGYFHSINTADGSENWDAFQPDGPVTGSPLVSKDFVVLGTESGTAYAIDNDGKIVWQQNVGERLYTNPVQSGELLLFAPTGIKIKIALVALDIEGRQVWQFTPEN